MFKLCKKLCPEVLCSTAFMTDEQFMYQAIEVARESAETYKHPVGAILVKDGKIVANGLSKDHTFHAELNCLHAALSQLDTSELSGCTLYTTHDGNETTRRPEREHVVVLLGPDSANIHNVTECYCEM